MEFLNKLDVNNSKVTEVATPTLGTDAANKDYVDSVAPTAVYTTTTAVTEGWYRIATAPIGSQFKNVIVVVKAYTATGTTTETTLDINLAYYSGSYTSQGSGIVANTSHSYNSQSKAENGYVLLYARVSFDATNAYLDVYKYKTTAVTIETKPLSANAWTWSEGALTVNPTVGSYRSTQTTLYQGLTGNGVTASSASYATYCNYGVLGTETISNTTDKTGQWAYFGYYNMDYNSSYLKGRSANIVIEMHELSSDGSKAVADLDNFRVKFALNLATHTDSATFNSTVPTFSIEVDGKTSLTDTDFAALVYSSTNSAKVVRLYVKLKAANTVYTVSPLERYGRAFNATTGITTSYGNFVYAGQQATIAALPTPAQGSVVYGTLVTHAHGNITSAGAIGSTANLPVITTTGGVLTTGSFGTSAGTFCQGNDSRLSDSRTASDVYAWAKAENKPSYTYSEVGAAASSHGHVKADISDFPTSMPASDVSAWAKAETKPTYTANEVGLGNVTNESKATMFTDPTFTGKTTANVIEVKQALGTISTNTTINTANGDIVTATLGAAITIGITANASTSTCRVCTLILTNGGAYTITWNSAIKWAGGSAPTLSASGVDILHFITVNNGTTWYGCLGGKGFA